MTMDMMDSASEITPDHAAEPLSLISAFRERTKALHTQAERSGIVAEILHQRATLDGYTLLLRNLLPAYSRLEAGLTRHRHSRALRGIARHEIYRATALEADLDALSGPAWRQRLPLLPAVERYADQIEDAAGGDGARLLAHAYTRYLGDLSGGQILKRLLAKSLALTPEQLSFYDFPQIADIAAFKADFRQAMDQATSAIDDVEAVVDEARLAFELNIALSEAVLQHGPSN